MNRNSAFFSVIFILVNKLETIFVFKCSFLCCKNVLSSHVSMVKVLLVEDLMFLLVKYNMSNLYILFYYNGLFKKYNFEINIAVTVDKSILVVW